MNSKTIKTKKKSKPKPKIKTILFDIGGVLQLPKGPVKFIQDSHLIGVPKNYCHKNKGVHNYIISKLKIPLDQWFDAIDTAYVSSIEGKIPEQEVADIIAHNLGISKRRFNKIIIKAYKINFDFNKELLNIALDLKKQGYKIGILSDQWHFSKRALMPEKYTKHFSPVIVSCDVGLRKPDPKIYKLALSESKSKPSQTIFIDNQKWNTYTAEKLGITSILFKDNKQLINDLKKLGISLTNY
jgi:epoxide hydrolase-like predicted phosphatase